MSIKSFRAKERYARARERQMVFEGHVGHEVAYGDNGTKQGTVASVAVDEGLGQVVIRLEKKQGHFRKKVFEEQVYNCLTCDKRKHA